MKFPSTYTLCKPTRNRIPASLSRKNINSSMFIVQSRIWKVQSRTTWLSRNVPVCVYWFWNHEHQIFRFGTNQAWAFVALPACDTLKQLWSCIECSIPTKNPKCTIVSLSLTFPANLMLLRNTDIRVRWNNIATLTEIVAFLNPTPIRHQSNSSTVIHSLRNRHITESDSHPTTTRHLSNTLNWFKLSGK